MRSLFEALSTSRDGAFIINDQNKIVFWNRAAERILGFSAEEVTELHCYEVLGGLDEQGLTLCQRYCRLAIRARQGRAVSTIDVHAHTAAGGRAWIDLSTLAFPSGNTGMGIVVVHLFRDASQRKKDAQFVA